MAKKGGAAAAGPKKRKSEQELDWDALLGDEMEEGGVDLDETGRVMVPDSRINYDFRSCPSALALSAPTLQRIIEDCQCVFGKGGGNEKTWWVACDGKPRCALEQLALAVFKEHAAARYDERRSGVEWWVQVRRGHSETQSIGFHWDKDEELVDEMGINVHPQISTVTYLTRDGSPTIVLDCSADTQYDKVQRRDISRAWVSFPSPLKHMSFDGRLLHGAPALQPLRPDAVRVTFLANVWLNHHPLALLPLPSSTAKRLLPPLPSLAINLKHSACSAAAAHSSFVPRAFSFGPTGSEAELTLPLPSVLADGGAGQSLCISYTPEVKAAVAPVSAKSKALKPKPAAPAPPPSAGGSGKRRK